MTLIDGSSIAGVIIRGRGHRGKAQGQARDRNRSAGEETGGNVIIKESH